MDTDVAELALTIYRGATWRPHVFPLLDRASGEPLRHVPPGGIVLSARIRPYVSSPVVRHTFSTQLVEIGLPDLYGPDPVLAAQLDEIPWTTTGAWSWDTGVWDLLVGHELAMLGPVSAPLVVSR